MINGKVTVDFNHISNYASDTTRKLSAAIRASAVDYEAEIKSRMRSSGGGRIYDLHQASAPGQPPAVDTGQLINSITTEIDDNSATIGTNVEYAMPLEFGTDRMAARPVWIPTLEDMKPEIKAKIESALK